MAWYAYCLTELQTLSNGTRARRPFLLEGIQGVNGSPVFGYPSGEFAVIVSEYDRNGGELDQKSVLEHARVVSAHRSHRGVNVPFPSLPLEVAAHGEGSISRILVADPSESSGRPPGPANGDGPASG